MLSCCIVRSKHKAILADLPPLVALSPAFRALKGEARSFKSVEPKPELMIHPDEGKKKRPPTALQVAHWITFKEEQRLEWQKAYLARLCQADQEIAQTYELIQGFTTMLRERQGDRLDSWLRWSKSKGWLNCKVLRKGLSGTTRP